VGIVQPDYRLHFNFNPREYDLEMHYLAMEVWRSDHARQHGKHVRTRFRLAYPYASHRGDAALTFDFPSDPIPQPLFT